jgi:hypothetical protein
MARIRLQFSRAELDKIWANGLGRALVQRRIKELKGLSSEMSKFLDTEWALTNITETVGQAMESRQRGSTKTATELFILIPDHLPLVKWEWREPIKFDNAHRAGGSVPLPLPSHHLCSIGTKEHDKRQPCPSA